MRSDKGWKAARERDSSRFIQPFIVRPAICKYAILVSILSLGVVSQIEGQVLILTNRPLQAHAQEEI